MLRTLRFSLLFLALVPALVRGEDAPADSIDPEKLPGTYRNLSFNVDGAGGAMRTMAPLTLFKGGKYTWSKEEGQWTIEAGKLRLSARPAWGDATVNKDQQIIFEFTRDGKRFTVTMYRAGNAPEEAPPAPKPEADAEGRK